MVSFATLLSFAEKACVLISKIHVTVQYNLSICVINLNCCKGNAKRAHRQSLYVVILFHVEERNLFEPIKEIVGGHTFLSSQLQRKDS